jgi:hypothetical protein
MPGGVYTITTDDFHPAAPGWSAPSPNAFPEPSREWPFEHGAPFPEPIRSEHRPPGDGRFPLAHFQTFSQIVNYASHTYRWRFDEALRHHRENALAIRRDPVVMDALRSRQIPTAQLPWHLETENDQDSRQAEAVETLTKIIETIPRFQQLRMHLLEALWWGRYGVRLVYQWDFSQGKKRLRVRDFVPIHGDKLIFKWSGQPGILVHATFPGSWQMTDRGRAHFFSPEEREAILIHKHEPEDADFFEGELAGQIHGVGIRSRIYYLWYLRQQVTAMMMDFLERVGAGGLTVYYYEHGNPQSEAEVTKAAEAQFRNNFILFPRYRDASTGGPGIERIEPSQAGAQLLASLVTDYFDARIRSFILGQTQVRDAAGAGLGSGVSDFLEGNLGRLIKYDAINLQETLTADLVAVLQRYMYPDLPPIRFVHDLDKPNAVETLQAAQAFYEMGGTLDEDQLRSILGLEKPQPGHSMLSQQQTLSPTAMNQTPTGTPMIGPPGPEAGALGAGGEPALATPPEAGAALPPMVA